MPQKEDKLLPFPSTAPYSLDSTQKADYELLNLNEPKENVDKDDKESNAEEKDESIDDEL
jgi:hypothetical protein